MLVLCISCKSLNTCGCFPNWNNPFRAHARKGLFSGNNTQIYLLLITYHFFLISFRDTSSNPDGDISQLQTSYVRPTNFEPSTTAKNYSSGLIACQHSSNNSSIYSCGTFTNRNNSFLASLRKALFSRKYRNWEAFCSTFVRHRKTPNSDMSFFLEIDPKFRCLDPEKWSFSHSTHYSIAIGDKWQNEVADNVFSNIATHRPNKLSIGCLSLQRFERNRITADDS